MRALPRVFLIVFALALAISPAYAGWHPGGVRLSPPLVGSQFIGAGGDGSVGSVISDGSDGAIATWILEEPTPYYGFYNSWLIAQRINLAGEIPAPWPSSGAFVRQWTNEHEIRPFPLLSDGAGGAIRRPSANRAARVARRPGASQRTAEERRARASLAIMLRGSMRVSRSTSVTTGWRGLHSPVGISRAELARRARRNFRLSLIHI